MPNVVIYARYSSHSQQETSIEGQLKECYAFCEKNGYTIIHEYIDRALSGTNANRPEFQQMISDAASRSFSYIVVYQLDRFSRDRYDSIVNKKRLQKYGVRVLSTRENITEDASGVLLESVIEGLAEYYSVELSQKVRRGMDINAQKCLSTGGNVAFGYKVGPDKKFIIDESTSPIVCEIFERYANGEPMVAIYKSLNDRGLKTSRNTIWRKDTITRILQNKRYTGVYTYKGTEVPDGIPRIISDDLFERVQRNLQKNKTTHSRAKPDGEYLLTTKLFCGHCKEMMRATGGTSKTGKQHHYYGCKNAINRKGCKKKNISKDVIETIVIEECKKILTLDNIKKISKAVIEQNKKDIQNTKLAYYEKQLAQIERKQQNLMDAIMECDNQLVRQSLYQQVPKLEEEKQQCEASIAREKIGTVTMTQQQVVAFLSMLAKSDINNIQVKKSLIAVLVNKIYLYDDGDNKNKTMAIIFNAGSTPVEVTTDIEQYIDALSKAKRDSCSTDEMVAPPTEPQLNTLYITNGFVVILRL